ncbi:uncharacterized protein LOC124497971 [Dermatophagoides farinae]|uniref:uncharacterized protein LOC124497971 n=1 Tax=Dermatophagoides farinae TaxID=6954 RepID=UPI003F5E49F0
MEIIDDYSDYYHDEIFIAELNPNASPIWYDKIWQRIDYLIDIVRYSSKITTFILTIVFIFYTYTFLTRKFPQIKCSLLFRCNFLSMKRILDKYEKLCQPGHYQLKGGNGGLPINVEYEPNDDEQDLIRKIRYKLKFEQEEEEEEGDGREEGKEKEKEDGQATEMPGIGGKLAKKFNVNAKQKKLFGNVVKKFSPIT